MDIIKRVWQNIVSPPAHITDSAERWRAQILLTFLFIGAFTSLWSSWLVALVNTTGFLQSDALPAGILFAAQQYVFYGIARFYSPRLALIGIVITTVVSLWVVALFIDSPFAVHALYFYAAINMFIGMLIPKKVLIPLYIFELIVFITAPYTLANVTWEMVAEGPLVFTITLTCLKWVADYHQNITERFRRRALETSEERYRSLIDNMEETVIIFDDKQQILLVNRKAERLVGFSREAIIERGYEPFIVPEDLPIVQVTLNRLFSGAPFEHFDIRVLNAEGETLRLEVNAASQSKNGVVNRVTVVARDVTEQYQAQEFLRASEERYRSLIDNMDEAVMLLDASGEMIMLNEAAERLLKLPRAAIFERRYVSFIAPDDVQIAQAAFARLFSGGAAEHFNLRIIDAAGETLRLEVNAASQSKNGVVNRVTVVARDVTEQYQAQEFLRASEERYRIIADALSDFTFCILIHTTGEITYEWVTSSFEEITGFNVQDKIVTDVFCTQEMFDEATAAIAEGRTVLARREIDVPTKGGEPRCFMVYRQLIVNKNGVRLYIAAQDITQRKAEAQRAMGAALEQQRIAMSSAFVRAISHDFRTWLATIETSRHLIDRILPEAERPAVQPKLIVISQAVEHLTEQLENLRTVTSINQSLGQPFLLPALLEHLVQSMQRNAEAKDISLTLDLPLHLPMIEADADQLFRAFRHLIENALMYTPAGGTVDIRAFVHERQIIIEIEDEGVGIAPEHLPHIFEMFYRADDARSIDMGGVGLGLSIVKMVVETFGGTVTARSAPNQGSVFTVQLPIFDEVIVLDAV